MSIKGKFLKYVQICYGISKTSDPHYSTIHLRVKIYIYFLKITSIFYQHLWSLLQNLSTLGIRVLWLWPLWQYYNSQAVSTNYPLMNQIGISRSRQAMEMCQPVLSRCMTLMGKHVGPYTKWHQNIRWLKCKLRQWTLNQNN